MPFHAAGGFVTAMLTSSIPAAHAALSASSPPMPPEGTESGAPCFAAARSRRARKPSSQSAPPESTMTAMPLESSASACSRTASCEAASITTSGRVAISFFTPMTKGAPNSRASALPREFSLRPATATTFVSPISPLRACSRKSLAMTPPPRMPTRRSAALRFLPEQPLAHLLHVHDEALVRAARDRVRSVVHLRLESHAPAVDLDELDRDGHLGPEQRRPHVLPVDLGAHRVLARVQVLEQKVPAGVFDVADDPRGGVDAAVLAHEADHAGFVDRDLLRVGKAGLEGRLHVDGSRLAFFRTGAIMSRKRIEGGRHEHDGGAEGGNERIVGAPGRRGAHRAARGQRPRARARDARHDQRHRSRGARRDRAPAPRGSPVARHAPGYPALRRDASRHARARRGRGREGRRPHRHVPGRGQRRERADRRRHARAHGGQRRALRRARAGQGRHGAQPRLSAGRIRTASAGNSCNKKKAAGYTGPPPRGLETLLLTNAYSARRNAMRSSLSLPAMPAPKRSL